MVTKADYLPRIADQQLQRALEAFPIVIIDGPRGVGKTTTAERVAASTIRLPEDLPMLGIDPASTLASLDAPVLIDEWQLAGIDLLWALKRLVDNDPRPGRFILTGSVEPATYGPTYPLTGRAVNVVMYPMTAAELAGAGHDATLLARLADGERPETTAGRSSSFQIDDLFATGFPTARDQPDPALFLTGYASLVAQRAGDEGRDASRLLRTMAVLGVLTAQPVPDQRIWDAADINKATWKAYDDLIRRVHLDASLPAFSSNRLTRLTAYPKRFLADTALALALANLNRDDLQRDPALIGRYIESHVVQQLRPQAEALGGHLTHLRSSAGAKEVDLLFEVGSNLFAFEVKAGSRPDLEDAKHLRWLQRELGDRLTGAFVIHTGGDTYALDDGLWALPVP